MNFFNKKTNQIKNQITGDYGPVPDIQRMYRSAGIQTIVVGDENFGEGSSREHAAMEPRHLGVITVLAKSFARIHETNLKKQGMLAITFGDSSDYDLIDEDEYMDLEEEFGIRDSFYLVKNVKCQKCQKSAHIFFHLLNHQKCWPGSKTIDFYPRCPKIVLYRQMTEQLSIEVDVKSLQSRRRTEDRLLFYLFRI